MALLVELGLWKNGLEKVCGNCEVLTGVAMLLLIPDEEPLNGLANGRRPWNVLGLPREAMAVDAGDG
jgi:hypothetical protein